MFNEQVITKNGVVKNVVAQSKEELDEAVKAVKAEQSAVAPDIHNPEDGNKIVSPDNLHTEQPAHRSAFRASGRARRRSRGPGTS